MVSSVGPKCSRTQWTVLFPELIVTKPTVLQQRHQILNISTSIWKLFIFLKALCLVTMELTSIRHLQQLCLNLQKWKIALEKCPFKNIWFCNLWIIIISFPVYIPICSFPVSVSLVSHRQSVNVPQILHSRSNIDIGYRSDTSYKGTSEQSTLLYYKEVTAVHSPKHSRWRYCCRWPLIWVYHQFAEFTTANILTHKTTKEVCITRKVQILVSADTQCWNMSIVTVVFFF